MEKKGTGEFAYWMDGYLESLVPHRGDPVLKEVELSIVKKHHVLGPMVRWYLKPTSFGYPISPIFTS